MNDPRYSKTAQFGSKSFVAKFEDKEGEEVTVIGVYHWMDNSEGRIVTSYDYWPFNEDLRDSVRDFIDQDLSVI